MYNFLQMYMQSSNSFTRKKSCVYTKHATSNQKTWLKHLHGVKGDEKYFLLKTSHIHLLDLQHEMIVVGEIVKTMASSIAILKQVVLFFFYLSLEPRFACS
jgi:hypothetical protein